MNLDRMQSGSRQIFWRRYDGGLVYTKRATVRTWRRCWKANANSSIRSDCKFKEAELPPDLAFITLVESEFKPKVRSRTNNAGLWQLEPITARLNGLKVNSKVDERLDPRKSTAAACRYITSLRQTLGPDTSLLVAVAAYNLGPSRLQSRMKTVSDADRQNDFWHLYSTRRIPALTRTHIARLMAAIIVGRNQERFGFGPAANAAKIARVKFGEDNSGEASALDREASLQQSPNKLVGCCP